jgi:hypothetical protein
MIAVPRRRFGERYGCFVVVLCLAALVGGAVLAFYRPAVGVPLELLVLVVCVLLLRQAKRRERQDAERERARLHAVAHPTGAAYRALIQAEGLGQHLAAIEPLARRAVRLCVRPDAADATGGSRLGGTPDLPPDLQWPRHKEQALTFLAQLDLTALGPLLPEGTLPAGHLFVFAPPVLTGAGTYADQQALVLHSEAAPRAHQGPVPVTGLDPFPSCPLQFAGYDDIPELDASPLNDVLDAAASDRYCGIRSYLSFGDEPASHKVLGHPDPIQGPVEEDCEHLEPQPGGSPWRVLLQVDSDERLGMMWGDAGRLYFCLREDDLANRRFNRVVAVMQCH